MSISFPPFGFDGSGASCDSSDSAVPMVPTLPALFHHSGLLLPFLEPSTFSPPQGNPDIDLEDFFAYASVEGVGEMAGWKHHESIEVSRAILGDFMSHKNVFALAHRESGRGFSANQNILHIVKIPVQLLCVIPALLDEPEPALLNDPSRLAVQGFVFIQGV